MNISTDQTAGAGINKSTIMLLECNNKKQGSAWLIISFDNGIETSWKLNFNLTSSVDDETLVLRAGHCLRITSNRNLEILCDEFFHLPTAVGTTIERPTNRLSNQSLKWNLLSLFSVIFIYLLLYCIFTFSPFITEKIRNFKRRAGYETIK